MITLAPGSVEWLALKITDVLPTPDALTTMVGTNPVFDLVVADATETVVLTDQGASIASGDPMIVLCLIDTTNLDEGDYNLFLKFTSSPETPRLGPFRFRVDD